MDLFVTVSLFVLSAAVITIGIMLTGIVSEVRKTRRAIERLGAEQPPRYDDESSAQPPHAFLGRDRSRHDLPRQAAIGKS